VSIAPRRSQEGTWISRVAVLSSSPHQGRNALPAASCTSRRGSSAPPAAAAQSKLSCRGSGIVTLLARGAQLPSCCLLPHMPGPA
jgi:hypothetical protein